MNGWIKAGFALSTLWSLGLIGCAASPEAKSVSYQPSHGRPATAQSDSWFDAPGQPAASAAPRDEAWGGEVAREAPAPESRPGLGTEWGETRSSHITTTPFIRADFSSPFTTTSFFYNDAEGVKQMVSAGVTKASSGMFSIGGGTVTVGMRDENGNFFNAFSSGEKKYVVGEAGTRYTIVLRNRTPFRFEVVLSVDGLDVIDGRDASFSKRGYLLDPNGELAVDGFRQSADSVASFRFGSVEGSYAGQKHGETRNVGVIGVALFHERGDNPFDWNNEATRRHQANPFPGQYASPP